MKLNSHYQATNLNNIYFFSNLIAIQKDSKPNYEK